MDKRPSVTGVAVVGFANPVYAANLPQQAKYHQSLSPYGPQINTHHTRWAVIHSRQCGLERPLSRGTRVALGL